MISGSRSRKRKAHFPQRTLEEDPAPELENEGQIVAAEDVIRDDDCPSEIPHLDFAAYQEQNMYQPLFSTEILSFDDAVEIILFPEKVPEDKICDSTPVGNTLLNGGSYVVDLHKLKSWRLIKNDGLGRYGNSSCINRWYRWHGEEYIRLDNRNKLTYGMKFDWQVRCTYARNTNYEQVSFQRKIYEGRDWKGKLQRVAVVVYHTEGLGKKTKARSIWAGPSIEPYRAISASQSSATKGLSAYRRDMTGSESKDYGVYPDDEDLGSPTLQEKVRLSNDPVVDAYLRNSATKKRRSAVGRGIKGELNEDDSLVDETEDMSASASNSVDYAFLQAETALDEAIKKCRDAKMMLRMTHAAIRKGTPLDPADFDAYRDG